MKLKLPKFSLGAARQKVVVEINNYFLKIAFFKGITLQWWKYRPIENASDREVSEIIKGIFAEKRVSPSTGILVISRELLKVGTLHLPSVDEQEIVSMVNINAQRQVPYPKDEIVLGWRITSTENGYSDVLLSICQRNLIRRFIVILETAGLSIEDIRMVSEGSLSWLLGKEIFLGVTEVNFILDIHEHYSDLIAFAGDNLLDSCIISQGADFLGKGQGSMEHFLNEFKQTTGMLPESILEKRPNTIFIIGAKQRFPQLEESLRKEFNLKVLRRETEQDFLPNTSFVALLGIGQKSLTKAILFDVPDIKIKKQWQRKIKQLILLGSFLAYIIIVVLITLGLKIYRAQDEVMRLQLDYSRYAKEAEELAVMMEGIKTVQAVKSPQKSLVYYLYNVSEVLPLGCRIVSLDFQRQSQLVIRGEAQAVSLVFDFISSLEETGAFKSVKTNYTRKIKAKAAAEGSEFEIVCFL
ncbi:MAG: hypothetical protein ABH914_01530 [Candidatus Omnitrophota bacterium]